MASFRKILSPDPRWEDLHKDLKFIGSSVATENLFKLFEAKVYALTNLFARARVGVEGEGSRLNRVITYVEDVKKDISSVPTVVIGANTTIKSFEEQFTFLRVRLAGLNKIQEGVYNPVEGSRAVDQDRAMIEQSIRSAKEVGDDPSDPIILHDMCNPSVPPFKVSCNFTNCREVRNYLIRDKKVKKPDIWREGKQEEPTLTMEGRCWEYVKQDATLPARTLQYVACTSGFNLYTVVLWHYIRRGTDTPVAIPIPISGTSLTLQQHLKNLRPRYMVELVREIGDGGDVTTKIFDAKMCGHRTNKLLVIVNKVGWAGWRERWKVVKERLMRSREKRVKGVRGYSVGKKGGKVRGQGGTTTNWKMLPKSR